MRKRVTKFISVLFITSSLLVALFPFFVVKADTSPTYKVMGECEDIYRKNNNYINTRGVTSGNNVRGILLGNNSEMVKPTLYLVSTNSFNYTSNTGYYLGNNKACSTTINTSSNTITKDNVLYYYVSVSLSDYTYDIAEFYVPRVYNGANIDNAIYYTFGAGSVDPVPPAPDYGDLIIEGYSTDIAGQGEASINNIDHIKWNGYVDSNGNDISYCKVRLQIIPGQYTGTSKSDLANKTRQDFILNPINASDSLFNASVGEVKLSWRDIVNRIDIIPYRLYSLELLGPDWQKDGWIYKLRLEDEVNDYIGEWQTVYSSTSNGVQNDLNITNITTINQTLVQTFQEINSINSVENNWIFNNTEISVENNYTEPTQGEKPWWAYLLESILNTFNITNNYIYEGDTNTQNINNTVNDSDDDMNRKIGEYQQFEDSFIDDMDDNLTDIDTDVDFLSDNKFIASANWVTQQYNRMTTNTVIGSFIGFSLLFGLALIFIGKIH